MEEQSASTQSILHKTDYREGPLSCFICFEEGEKRLLMSDCGCREIIHEKCIGEWISKEYEMYGRGTKIRCPICNQYGYLLEPTPIIPIKSPEINEDENIIREELNNENNIPLIGNNIENRRRRRAEEEHREDVSKKMLMILVGMIIISFLFWIGVIMIEDTPK
jgi:hypothetical protein